MSFNGFPPDAVSFYREIRINNNREWFAEHKSDYTNLVLAPAAEFVGAFGGRLQSIFPAIQYDPRTSGSGSIMRIYRDTRFSKDKTPYKTWLRIVFWHGDRKKTENPAFYFGLDHEGAHLHCGWHGLPKEVLHAFRVAVADDQTGSELEGILSDLRASGYETGKPHYKRVPGNTKPIIRGRSFSSTPILASHRRSLPPKILKEAACSTSARNTLAQCRRHFSGY